MIRPVVIADMYGLFCRPEQRTLVCYDTALALVNPEEVFAIHVEHMQALKVVNVHGH